MWNPKTSQRFYKSTTDAPGSGTYYPQFNDMSDSGKYTLTKFIGHGKRKFDLESRDSFVHLPAKQTKSKYSLKYSSWSWFLSSLIRIWAI